MKLEIPIIIIVTFVISLTLANIYNAPWEQYKFCEWGCVFIIYLLCVHVYDGVGDLIREIKELKYMNKMMEEKIESYRDYVARMARGNK